MKYLKLILTGVVIISLLIGIYFDLKKKANNNHIDNINYSNNQKSEYDNVERIRAYHQNTLDIGKKNSELILNTSEMFKIEYKDEIVSRNGDDYDSLTWVVSRNGNVVLERDAAHEMEMDVSDFKLMYGGGKADYTCYLKMYINGKYQAVSNLISWTE